MHQETRRLSHQTQTLSSFCSPPCKCAVTRPCIAHTKQSAGVLQKVNGQLRLPFLSSVQYSISFLHPLNPALRSMYRSHLDLPRAVPFLYPYHCIGQFPRPAGWSIVVLPSPQSRCSCPHLLAYSFTSRLSPPPKAVSLDHSTSVQLGLQSSPPTQVRRFWMILGFPTKQHHSVHEREQCPCQKPSLPCCLMLTAFSPTARL